MFGVLQIISMSLVGSSSLLGHVWESGNFKILVSDSSFQFIMFGSLEINKTLLVDSSLSLGALKMC